MENRHIKIMPPLDGVINDLNDRLGEIEGKFKSFNSRMSQYEKDLAKLDGKIRRIEKYAR